MTSVRESELSAIDGGNVDWCGVAEGFALGVAVASWWTGAGAGAALALGLAVVVIC